MGTLKAGTFLGTFTPEPGKSYGTYAIQFTEGGALIPATEFMGGYVPRSRNFVLASAASFTQATGFNDTLAAELAASTEGDTGGYLPPAGFTTPNGWVRLTDQEGRPYYKRIANGEGSSVDSDGDGIADKQQVRSANFLTQITDWVKANPIWAVVIVVAIVIVYQQSQGGRRRKKKFLGIL